MRPLFPQQQTSLGPVSNVRLVANSGPPLLRVRTSPPHLSRDCEDANSIGRAKSIGKSDQPKRISSLLPSERRKLRNHPVRATTGTGCLRAEDSRL